MKKTVFGMLLFLSLVVLLGVPAADAGPLTLQLESGGINVIVVDNGANDSISELGVVSFFGTVGSVEFNVVTGLSKPMIGDPDVAELHMNSVNINMRGSGSVTLTLIDNDFLLPSQPVGTSLTAVGSVGGVLSAPMGSLVSFQSWLNTANSMTATPTSAGSLAVLDYGPVTSSSFSTTSAESFIYSGSPFSLFTQAEINFTGTGSVSFDNVLSVPTPEPASMILFGTGLMGVALIARRWHKRASKELA